MRLRVFFFVSCFLLWGASPSWALSCEQPVGDMVVQSIEGTAGSNFWFGSARITKYNKENGQSTFDIDKTYLAVGGFKDGDSVPIQIAPFLHDWGPNFTDYVRVNKESELASFRDYFMIYDDVNEMWLYAGPGACLYFSEEEWRGLKKGHYNYLIEPKLNEKIVDEEL